MKQIIFSTAFIPIIRIFRWMRTVGLIHIQESSALVLPPTSPGSLGDEALVTSAVNYLKNNGIKYIGLVSYKSGCQWRSLCSESVDEVIDMETYFAHKNRLFWKALFWTAPKVGKYERFYCLGADMIDGHYSDQATFARLKLTSVAADMGVESSVLGFSFNDQPTTKSKEVLRNLPSQVRLYARDPFSQARFVAQINRPIQLVADLAFLLKPAPDSDDNVSTILKWIKEQNLQDRIVIGININNKKLIEIYVKTLVGLYLQNNKVSFVMIPHDFRDFPEQPNDVVLTEKIVEQLPDSIKAYVCTIPIPCLASEVKGIVAHLDFVLSGRMHATIACLGQSTPVVGITYQGKFEGLFKLFDIEGMTIAPEKALEAGSLVDFLLPLIEKREEIHQKIKSKLPEIEQLAKANFELIK